MLVPGFIDDIITLRSDSEAVAMSDGDRSATYREMHDQSGRLASYLLNRGSSDPLRVVILLGQSIEALVCIMGVLRAGGVYIPLDPLTPEEKLRALLNFISPDLVIAESGLFQAVPLPGHRTLPLAGEAVPGSLEAVLADRGALDPTALAEARTRRTPADTAYVIFTSGTTGIPKGVMISHRSVLNYLHEVSALAGYAEDTRFLNIPPLHFDAHLIGFFCVFYQGGQVRVVRKFGFPNELVRAMERFEITDVTLIPTVMKMLVSRFSDFLSVPLPHLRTVMFGAETCSAEVLRQIKQAHPQLRFIHGYGPTEATCGVLYHVFEDAPAELVNGNFTMGKPLPGTWVYALNEDGDPIRPYEEGELYIGGVQLMQGYYQNEEQTSAALVRSTQVMGERAYRTGDYVTVSDKDEYYFIGRKDDMVKIHGMIVRLSEVKAVMLDCHNVLDVLLVPGTLDSGDTAVYAFVSLKDVSAAFDRSAAVEFLRRKLSAHMIPADFFVVDPQSIPMKSSGKVDDQALLRRFIPTRSGSTWQS